MDTDTALALIGLFLLICIPIATGIYNDIKRSPRGRRERCWVNASTNINEWHTCRRIAVRNGRCKEHQ